MQFRLSFHGIRVMQGHRDHGSGVAASSEMESLRSYYLTFWGDLLRGMLDWTPEQVAEWSEFWDTPEDLQDVNSLFYHEDPLYYVISAVAPIRIWRTLSFREGRGLENELIGAVILGAGRDWETRIDWQAARVRVEEVLNRYGCSLAESRSPEEYLLRQQIHRDCVLRRQNRQDNVLPPSDQNNEASRAS